MRGVLDSLGQSMFPRTVMVQGQANLADVRQTAIGSIIRVAQHGAVTELTKPFMGKEALPIMEVLESHPREPHRHHPGLVGPDRR